jgi:tetratricopeptide (TPR) repeat protein
MRIAALISILLFCVVDSKAQNAPQIREIEEECTTYPYSDPNPIPAFGKVYPYFRFDGFTTKSQKMKHKVVVLENDWLRIKVFPGIGGKIWSVVDKTCGKEMFYDNKVVKFRDISMRGAWTSGGIEFNYGLIGHAPSCSFPVDYRTAHNPDGSVSCWISNFDLHTRTRWTVEINLPKDKGWFTTSSFWHNGNSASRPYYHWMNAGIDATKDLELIYPGTYSIAHEGQTMPWPLDEERGKNLSHWADNDFDGAKSYHIAGTNEPWFGAYWSDGDFGMMHLADRDEKLGKKFFTWALSDQGDIWVDLLTDTNGQYLEVQSGRLFNQNVAESSLTPYKQFHFTPYGTDVWTEYWFPFRGTGGVADASLFGVVNATGRDGILDVSISPLQSVSDTLELCDADGSIIASQPVSLSVAGIFRTSFAIPQGSKPHKLTLAGREIWSREEKTMGRPSTDPDGFDYETAYGKYLLGRDYAGMGLYDRAEEQIKGSLALDATFIPTLVEMSRLCHRRMDYEAAYSFARKALSIDAYDPEANFEYGRAALRLGKQVDALDGFEIAAITTPLRSAAYTEIGKIYFIRKDFGRAAGYAEKSLINNGLNIEGLQILYMCHRQRGEMARAEETAERIFSIDPFNPMISFETTAPDMDRFSGRIRNEMPVQTFLELAIWYHSLGQDDKSRTILEAAPANAEVKYWLAFLNRDTPQEAAMLKEAEAQSPSFVFPFRPESEDVFAWAMTTDGSWQPTYYMALLQGAVGNLAEAHRLLETLGDRPDFPPFYALRASLSSSGADRERDLRRAVSIDLAEWRYVHLLTNLYLERGDYPAALRSIEPLHADHGEHFPTALLYTRALMYNGDYKSAENIFSTINILPFEGEKKGRVMYREIKTMLAAGALAGGKTKEAAKKIAEARLWPRNVGVGKPYDNMIDSRLEDWISAMIAAKSKKQSERRAFLVNVAHSTHNVGDASTLLQCLALWQLDERKEADELLARWSSMQDGAATKEWGEELYRKNRDSTYPFCYEDMTALIGLVSGTRDSRLFQ